MYNSDDTIVAVSTPVGEGGIGIVRMSGKDALRVADRIFVSRDGVKPSEFKTYTLRYGYIKAPESPLVIDEVLLTVMRSPKSYTKEDIVEINCHGGVVPMKKIMDLVMGLGARVAEPGEFTRRAFLNGRLDLSQAEAVLDIIKSKTESSLKIAMDQLKGAFSKDVNNIRERLLDLAANLEANIDFADDDIEIISKKEIARVLDDMTEKIGKLIKSSESGMILKEGVLCVICGKPNVGKSSLMNAILRRNRVIVTPVPGTTRDAIEEVVSISGIPVRIADTAGIDRPKDAVEKEGISRSKAYLKNADLVIFMLDMSAPLSVKDKKIYSLIKKKEKVVVANKSDLKRKLDMKSAQKALSLEDVMEVSVLKKKNIDILEEAISRKIWRGEVKHPEGALVTNLRHKRSLIEARNKLKSARLVPDEMDLLSQDVKEAVWHLGTIIGKSVDTEILDRIFSKFCIGK